MKPVTHEAKRKMQAAIPCCVLAFALCVACERETRQFREPPLAATRPQQPVNNPLSAGPQRPSPPPTSPYQENAWGIAEGKRLFENFNCVGCHAHGGGGMGPALMDDEWIYGAHPANIFETIVQGRPNGMPSFRDRLPDQLVWQIVAYVQSMSGQAPIDALPGRSDHLRYSTPENARPAETPVQTGRP
jgi:cytochrome c oxidase cbb3-type subunit III